MLAILNASGRLPTVAVYYEEYIICMGVIGGKRHGKVTEKKRRLTPDNFSAP
jgi:hypothetical protein